jgi:ubiquinone/menaquinone biosynthesis C-methylase UbiE
MNIYETNMRNRYTTKQHHNYWENRKIDWDKHYTETWNHPHRQMITNKLKEWKWISILEVGCASGPNLIKIWGMFPRADVAGIDINPDAVKTAQRIFDGLTQDWHKEYKNYRNRPWFKVNSGDNIMISDDATDIIMSDMTLIYIGSRGIKKYLKEMHRVTRGRIMLMEFHHKSWLKRFVFKLKTGYNAHNYKKLLTEVGFRNIEVVKLPPELWDNHEPQKTMAYLITAQK